MDDTFNQASTQGVPTNMAPLKPVASVVSKKNSTPLSENAAPFKARSMPNFKSMHNKLKVPTPVTASTAILQEASGNKENKVSVQNVNVTARGKTKPSGKGNTVPK